MTRLVWVDKDGKRFLANLHWINLTDDGTVLGGEHAGGRWFPYDKG